MRASATIRLPGQDIATLDEAIAPAAVRGGRYTDAEMTLLNR